MAREAALIIVLLVCATSVSANLEDEAQELFSEYFEWKLNRWALDYNFEGFDHNPTAVDDLSLEAFDHQARSCLEFSRKAEDILIQDSQILDVRTRRYVKILMRETEECYNGAAFKVSKKRHHLINNLLKTTFFLLKSE